MNTPAKTAAALTALASLAPVAGSAKEPRTPAARPNILCLVCEDISSLLACYGDPVARTPNLDRLASEGIRYNNMFTTIGVSAPSRFSLITGMYPSACGANNMRTTSIKPGTENGIEAYEALPPAGVKCYTEFLRAAGYFCTNANKTDYQFHPPVTAWDQNGKGAHWKNRPEGVPFFSIFNIGVTHESQIWQRADQPLVVDPDRITPPLYHPDSPTARRDWAVVYSNIYEMDRQVQEYIDQVRQAGLLDNTIIIWYSDNGGPMPRHKRELYDSGTRVPFMVRFPDGRMAGVVDDELHLFADIPATILSLAGVQPPSYMHGRAFLGDYTGRPRDYVYGARDRFDEALEAQTAIRDRRYRLIHNYMPERSDFMPGLEYHLDIPTTRELITGHKAGTLTAAQEKWFLAPRSVEEFYDLEKDPQEIHNLIGDPAYASQIKRLRAELARWDKAYNPFAGRPEQELRESLWPGGVQPRTAPVTFQTDKQGRVSIRCATSGASIAYRINGCGPDGEGWFLYTGPVELKSGDRVTALAHRIGCQPAPQQDFVR